MASHDFCPGCPKCDAEWIEHLKRFRKDKLKETIGILKNIKPTQVFTNGQEKIEYVIAMLNLEIESIK